MSNTTSIDIKSGRTPEETTPLLIDSRNGEDLYANRDGAQEECHPQNDSVDVPLPKSQIILLCFARFVEPVVYFSIFPFVQEMVVNVGGVAKAEVGFYSGLIESLFSLTQMLLMIPWGWVSDKVGRKPVLLLSMAGIMVFTTLFGFSQNLWQMIMFRCLAGVFAGSVVTIRTMITEHSTPKTQARAFSFFQFSSNLGVFIGPFIGGALADPAHQYPSAFKNVEFFHHFPYALPTLVTGIICGIAVLTSAIFVRETLKEKQKTDGQQEEGRPDEQLSFKQLLYSPGVLLVMWAYGVMLVLAYGFTAVIPVFWFTPIELGGCNFPPLFLSIFLAGAGLSQSIYGLLVFPPLQLRYGTKRVLQGCAIFWPFAFLGHVGENLLLRAGLRVMFWILAVFLGLGTSAVSMAFIAIQLAINDSAPSPSSLGTLNGVALAVMSGTRAFTPALFTSIFATGVTHQILKGQLAWLVLTLCSIGFLTLVQWLPRSR